MTTQFEIRQHPASDEHKIAIVTTPRGYVYACVYAPMDEELTIDYIKREWKTARKAFEPFDTSSMRFV